MTDTVAQHIRRLGGEGILTDSDIASFSQGCQRIYQLMCDGQWYDAVEIREIAGENGVPASEGLRRMRELRDWFYIDTKRKEGTRLWEYRLLPLDAAPTVTMRKWDGVKAGKYYLVDTMDKFWDFHRNLKEQHRICIDTETNGLDIVRSVPCGIVVGWGVENNYYLPIDHKTDEPQLDMDQIRGPLQEVFGDKAVTKVFWNAKFDMHMLLHVDLHVRGVVHDGVVMLHLLDENTSKELKIVSEKLISRSAGKWENVLHTKRGEIALARRKEFSAMLRDVLAKERPQLEEKFFEENPKLALPGAIKKGQLTAQLKKVIKLRFEGHPLEKNKKEHITYDYVPLDIMTPYAAADTHYTLLLFKDFFLQIAQHDDLKKRYLIEMELSGLLMEVETYGVQIDVDYLKSQKPKIEQQVRDLHKDICDDVGFEVNIDSNQQLIQALKKAGVRLTRLTKAGVKAQKKGEQITEKMYSVDAETLDYLAAEFPFASKIKKYREKQKLLGTYIINIIELVDGKYYLHSTFNANVSTGRMSSKEPNVQNIPANDPVIRRAFIVPSGNKEYVFVFLDYSQIELRLTAHWSKDPILLSAYPWDAPYKDVHSMTCADVVMNVPLELVLQIIEDEDHPEFKEYKFKRDIAKRVNFGIIYGAGPPTIQSQVSTPERFVTRDQCKIYIAKYFQRYQAVKQWINVTTHQLKRDGYLQNTFGRYRRLEVKANEERWKQERKGRQGVNFLIQGDAADLFKTAAVRVDRLLKKNKAKTRIVNFVHDEMQFYWHKKELDLLPQVKSVMEDFPQFRVPIEVDIEYSGTDWASKKTVRAAA